MSQRFDNEEEILRVLGELTEPPTLAQLVDALRTHFDSKSITGRWLNRMIERSQGRLVLGGDGVVRASLPQQGLRVAPPNPTGSGYALRVVAIDFETIPRHREDGSVERLPLEVGAVRFGHDEEWVKADPRGCCLINQPSKLLETYPKHPVLQDAVARGMRHEEVASRLVELIDGAQLIVGYNSHEVDEPALRALLGKENAAFLEGVVFVDALYLAHAVLPQRAPITTSTGRLLSAHQLEAVAFRLGHVAVQEHRALADCELLVEVLTRLAARFDQLDPCVRDVVCAATRSSHAWLLLIELQRPGVSRVVQASSDVTRCLEAVLGRLPPLREDTESEASATGNNDFVSDLQATGPIDAYGLAALIRDGAQRRKAQEAASAAVRSAVAGQYDVLIEAPTGSGKSLVLLAAALDWVAQGDDRRAIISTFTKQLQSQLAQDLDKLNETVAGLTEEVDLVKGASNRLSLRGLVTTVVGLASGEPSFGQSMTADAAFQEVIVYLLLRLLANVRQSDVLLSDRWTARSVDPVDLPGAFRGWCAGQLSRYLSEVSQSRVGDWRPNESLLAAQTQGVREALRGRRLIIANHALLCSTTRVLDEMSTGQGLLLLIDEAHELESAATSTLTRELDYVAIEAVRADLERIAAGRTGPHDDDEWAHFARSVQELQGFLRSESFPRAVAIALGIRAGADLQAEERIRQATIADPDSDGAQLASAARVATLLRVLLGHLISVSNAIDALPQAANLESADARATMLARLGELISTTDAIQSDIAALLGEEQSLTTPDSQLTLKLDSPARAATEPNRVVWARADPLEGKRLERFVEKDLSLRWWPFSVAATAIAVADDPSFAQLRSAPAVTVFMSGTLTVPSAPDPWLYIRQRLGLPLEVQCVEIPSDFDPESQGLLVAFEDFPSWSEQSRGAIASIAWQLTRYAREVVRRDGTHGALVLTTSRAAAAAVYDELTVLRIADDHYYTHSAIIDGNAGGLARFKSFGGVLVGTRGLWQGVDVADSSRVRLVWINKLPFPPVGDPVIDARRAAAERAAARAGHEDPEDAALSQFYLPLAATALRQAVGRLLRSPEHRGVVVISDNKLGGDVRLRRKYREVFLGGLDKGWARRDEVSGDIGAGNVATMEEAWAEIWSFLSRPDVRSITEEQAQRLSAPESLAEHVWLPHTRTIRAKELTPEQETLLRAEGHLADELVARASDVGGALQLLDGPLPMGLRSEQEAAIRALAAGRDVLGILPTGYGKSFLFQLPGLILPGVTVVVSPLVSLMTDQAMKLNRTVGGAVRALVGPMRESNSRMGKAQVLQQLTGERDWGIKIVYMAPERLATRQFQDMIWRSVERGIVRLLAFDEAHTLASWGDTFRPSIRRAEHFVRKLRAKFRAPQLIAVTATATRSVRAHLLRKLLEVDPDAPDPSQVAVVTADPIRPDLAVHKRTLAAGRSEADAVQVALVEATLEAVDGHAIVYCTTVKEVERVYGYLVGALGRQRRVLKYHGRMDDLERASVANYFTSAAKDDDPEGSQPMVVVATKAFGLGIDRDDIRLVLCASPPGDLSELYQAVGRAGRGQAGRVGSDLRRESVGASVMSRKAWATLCWFNRHNRSTGVLVEQIIAAITSGTSPLDVDITVEELVRTGIADGRLPSKAENDEYLHEEYESLVVRTFVALADEGIIADLGDSPVKVTLKAGERLAGDRSEAADLARAVLSARPGRRLVVELEQLFNDVAPELREDLADVGGLWFEMMSLYATGHLDVSQRSNTGHMMNYRVLSQDTPSRLEDHLLDLQRGRTQDLRLLREWFEDEQTCALVGLAEYFDAGQHRTNCVHPLTRCSCCWADPGNAAELRPNSLQALMTDLQQLRSRVGRVEKVTLKRVERAIEGMLRDYPRGMGERKIREALLGNAIYFSGRSRGTVPQRVRHSKWFGQAPSAKRSEVRRAIERLVSSGALVANTNEGRVWWTHRRHAVSEDQ